MSGASSASLLFDECVDQSLAVPAFAPHAHITFVRDVMPGAGDVAVLAHARSQSMVLVTEDAGFGRLLFQMVLAPPQGVILIALDPLARDSRAARLVAAAPEALAHASGAFVTIGPKTIRTRTY